MLYPMVQSGTDGILGKKPRMLVRVSYPKMMTLLCALIADKSPLPKNRRIIHPNMET